MKKLHSWFLALTTLTVPACLCTSCANNSTGDTLDIQAQNYSFSTTERSIDVVVEFKNNPHSDVYVRIDDAPDGVIYLKQNIFNVSNKTLNITIYLTDEVTEDSYINFNLSFFIEKSTKKQSVKLYDFTYYYHQIEDEDDLISIENKTSHSVNKHKFIYTLYFVKEPQTNAVKVDLLDEPSQSLSLPFDTFHISKMSEIKAEIELDLDLGVYLNQAFSFNLRFNFVNSKGKEQSTKLYGFVALYERQKQDIIPDEYFDTERISGTNDELILHGIKKEVNLFDLVTYKIIKIPENVVAIDPEAFGEQSIYENITEIFIPKSVKSIGENAFSGCLSLCELDLNDYGSIVPQWVNDDTKIFGGDQLLFDVGYVWVDALETSILPQLLAKGLRELWNEYKSINVTQRDFYNIDSTLKEITGITEKGKSQLSQIKVIKIPAGVKSIDENALNDFKTSPYVGTSGLETRRLVLNRDIEEISNGVFSNAGISGPIVIGSPYISKLPEDFLQDCATYLDPYITGVIKEANNILYFVGCNNLTTIAASAFNMVELNQTEIVLPHNIQTIGLLAFAGSSVQKIRIPHTLDELGQYAFANVFYPSHTPKLETIDLSDYNVILNPRAHESEQTYLPSWFEVEQNDTFLNVCTPSGKIILTTQVKKEVWNREEDEDKREEKFKEWEKNFKLNHGVPIDWTIDYV